jgi:hypothetical protein
VESITREREAADRALASSEGAATTPTMLDSRSLSRLTRPARKLQGCAREDCLEVAKLGSDHCPLHD